MVHAFVKDAPVDGDRWSNVTIALTTTGTFRVPIPAGIITYNQLVTVCPWENRLVALTLRGHHILQLLENSVAPMNASSAMPTSSRFLQVSGMQILYDLKAKVGERVVSVRVRCSQCQVPKYKPLVPDEKYRLVVMEYLASGNNGFTVIADNAEDIEWGPLDLDAWMEYMVVVGPITAGIEHRIQFVQ